MALLFYIIQLIISPIFVAVTTLCRTKMMSMMMLVRKKMVASSLQLFVFVAVYWLLLYCWGPSLVKARASQARDRGTNPL